MLGEPPFFLAQDGRYPQCNTLLAKKRVTSVTTAKGFDLVPLWKVHDGHFRRVARPVNIGFPRGQRVTNRVEALDELPIPQGVQHPLPHPRHDTHAGNDVLRVSELHTNLGEWGTDWSHTKRYDIHGTSYREHNGGNNKGLMW